MSIYTDKPWRALYPEGMAGEIIPEYVSMLDAFKAVVTRSPDAILLKYFDTAITASELDSQTDALACALVDRGLVRGDRVALYLQNVPQYVVGLLAIWKVGAFAVSVNPMLKSLEVRRLLDDSGAKAIVCLENLYVESAREAVQGSTVQHVITTSELDFQNRHDPRLFAGVERVRTEGTEDLVELLTQYAGRKPASVELGADDPAVLTYTSGTTGVPKGAVNTHGNVMTGGQTYRDWFALTSDDSVLGVAPLFHVTGLSGHIATAIITGAPLVLAYRFDPAVMLELVKEHRPTFVVGAITVFIALANAGESARDDLASLTKYASGGAPIAPAVVDDFERKTGAYIHNVYGMTETTSPTHSTPLGTRAPVDPTSGALSVGVPVPSCEMWVVDEDNRELPPGEVGELLVAGPRVVPGYWNKPDETAATFVNGRLRTGDVGFLDEQGWFYLVDRKKDMIIASGYKVWPREVEDVLYSHPAVMEAAVVGVPDEYRGETVVAFVSPKPGTDPQAAELVQYCRERMAAYKYPRTITILGTLPKTPTGKILRRQLRDSVTGS